MRTSYYIYYISEITFSRTMPFFVIIINSRDQQPREKHTRSIKNRYHIQKCVSESIEEDIQELSVARFDSPPIFINFLCDLLSHE